MNEPWCVRDPNEVFNPEEAYVNYPENFSIEIHHGGEFTEYPGMTYAKGKVSYVDKVNSDYFSVIVLKDMMVDIGYREEDDMRFMYRFPGEDLDLGLRPLLNDGYILDLLKLSRTTKLIDVFVEHIRPDYEGLQLRNNAEHDINENVDDGSENSAADGEHIVEEILSSDGSENSGSDGSENSGSDGSDDSNFEPKAGDYEQDDSSDIDEVSKGKAKVDEVSKGKAKVDYVSDEDSDYIMDVDNIVEEYDVDMDDFRAAVDFDLSDDGADLDIGDDVNMDVEIDLDEFDSLSDDENDTKMQKRMRAHRRKHKKTQKGDGCPFFLGQTFSNKEQIKRLLKKHAVESRRQLMIVRNNTSRFRVVCKGFNPKLVRGETEAKDGAVAEDVTNIRGKTKAKGLEVEDVTVGGISGSSLNAGGTSGSSLTAGDTSVNSAKSASGPKVKPKPKKRDINPTCPWLLHISKSKSVGSWVVKTFLKEHICLNTRDVRLCTIGWLAKEIEGTIRINPTIPLKSLQDMIQKKFPGRSYCNADV